MEKYNLKISDRLCYSGDGRELLNNDDSHAAVGKNFPYFDSWSWSYDRIIDVAFSGEA